MSVEVIVFPDLIKAMIPYLRSRLVARGMDVPVHYRIPAPRPDTMVRVAVVGGSRLDLIHQQARILVEAWSPDEPAAASLAALVEAEIEAACRMQEPIAPGVWLNADPRDFFTPLSFPDPLTSSPRYQFHATLILTGSAL